MLTTGAVALLLMGLASLVLRHRQENQRLIAEVVAFRQQIESATPLRGENLRLAEQLKTATQTARSNRAELMPYRAQISRLRQLELENAKLTRASQRLVPQTALATQAQSAIEQSEQPPHSGECPKCHLAVTGSSTYIDGIDAIRPVMVFKGRCIPCGVDLVSDVSKTGIDMIIQWQLEQ